MTATSIDTQGGRQQPRLSVVVPIYNEADNLVALHARIAEALRVIPGGHELIYVDDGSSDAGPHILREIAGRDPAVRVVFFKTNFGQTAAMSAGIDHCRGDVIVTLDGDLQNDPMDIPKLLDRLDEGYDLVSGWRRDRQDSTWTRKVPSNAANWLISKVTGLPLHDYGCTLKAYRRSVFEEVRLYGEMHRFIPAYAFWAGARVSELEVRHHPRRAGVSKYGLSRTVKVVLDLLTMTFLHSYSTKPLYVFGGAGLICFALAALVGAFVTIRRLFFYGQWMSPLILVTAVLFMGAIQLVLMGLLAEITVRTYHESAGKRIYAVREVVPPVDRRPEAEPR